MACIWCLPVVSTFKMLCVFFEVNEDLLSKQKAEEEASLKLIAELIEEEAKQEEQERKDAELAAALSKELNGVCMCDCWLACVCVCVCVHEYIIH